MKADPGNHRLLNDILEQAAPEAFRAGLLRGMLDEVQHQKQRRRRNLQLLAAACVVAALALLTRFLPPSPRHTPANTNDLLVHSQPLPRSMIVTTQSGIARPIRSADFTVSLVENLPAHDLFESINDDKLFALLEGRPAALVRRGPADTELVFLNPADRAGFEVH